MVDSLLGFDRGSAVGNKPDRKEDFQHPMLHGFPAVFEGMARRVACVVLLSSSANLSPIPATEDSVGDEGLAACIEEEGVKMEPEFVECEGFIVLGTVTRFSKGTENPEVFARIWRDFESRMPEVRRFSDSAEFYGVSNEQPETDEIEYVAGMAVSREPSVIPEGLAVRRIHPAWYAVFSCVPDEIGHAYRHIFSEWLPQSGHELNPAIPVYECYPPAEDTESPVRIYVPVKGNANGS